MFSLNLRRVQLRRVEAELFRLHFLLKRALLMTSTATVCRADRIKNQLPEFTPNNNPLFLPKDSTLHPRLEIWLDIADRCRNSTPSPDLLSGPARSSNRVLRSSNIPSGGRTPSPSSQHGDVVSGQDLAMLYKYIETYEGLRNAIRGSILNELEARVSTRDGYAEMELREDQIRRVMKSRGRRSALRNCVLAKDV